MGGRILQGAGRYLKSLNLLYLKRYQPETVLEAGKLLKEEAASPSVVRTQTQIYCSFNLRRSDTKLRYTALQRRKGIDINTRSLKNVWKGPGPAPINLVKLLFKCQPESLLFTTLIPCRDEANHRHVRPSTQACLMHTVDTSLFLGRRQR